MNNIDTRKVFILGKTFDLSGYTTDNYYRHIVEDSMADADILAVASLLLPKDGVAIDVGANIGYESLFFALVMPKGKVYAFEPVPSNVALIKQNIKQNNLSNIKVYDFGLGDKQYETEIIYREDSRGGAFVINEQTAKKLYNVSEPVTVKILDRLVKNNILKFPRCDLIKVDIEGLEPAFLRGANNFINTFRPSMIIEANHWCLDGLQGVTMASFINQLEQLYPYIAAFDKQEWADVRKDRVHFMHDNMVFRKFQNLYCDFEKERFEDTIKQHQWGWNKLGDYNSASKEAHEAKAQLKASQDNIDQLENQLRILEKNPAFRGARSSYRAARKVRGRLQSK